MNIVKVAIVLRQVAIFGLLTVSTEVLSEEGLGLEGRKFSGKDICIHFETDDRYAIRYLSDPTDQTSKDVQRSNYSWNVDKSIVELENWSNIFLSSVPYQYIIMKFNPYTNQIRPYYVSGSNSPQGSTQDELPMTETGCSLKVK